MKLINLIPTVIKEERQNQKFKKTLIGLGCLPLGMYLQMQISINGVKKEITAIETKTQEATTLENEIKSSEELLFNDMRISNVLSHEAFPLHRFLLFLSTKIPEDIRLYSVSTEQETVVNSDGTTTDQTKSGDTKPLTEVTSPNSSNNKTSDSSSTAQQGTNQDANAQNSQITSGTNNQQTTDQQNPNGAKTVDGAKQTNLTPEQELKKFEEMAATTKTIYLRGASLSLNSIGQLMNQLELNPYVKKVDMNDVQNYYNGTQSYKFFELIIETK